MSVATYGPVSDLKYLNWSKHPITFSKANQWSDILYLGCFPLILDPIIKDVHFQKVLIDGASTLNILFAGSLEELGLKKEDLTPMDSSFWGIIPRKASLPLGHIILSVKFGTAKHFYVDYINFLVTDFNTAYHAIVGRLVLAKFMVVLHYMYLVLKMPIEQGVLSLLANLDVAYNYEKESFALVEVIPLEDLEIPTLEATRASTKSREFKEVVLVPGDQSKTARIGANLDPEDALVSFLREHVDVFAWKPMDMLGVLRELIKHSLNVSATAKPIKQKLRRFTIDKKEAIRVEITRLLATGFIKEVYHLDWLANPVLIALKEED
ncbi:uncharacterized protein [Miscanthus floridulus]|uniref:uncharacterized protein n=1 Tax=Miscanthus floridulus TaxID=154761 RepID=UPI00345AEF1F